MRFRGVRPWPEERARAYRAAGYWRGETLPQLLCRQAAAHGQRTALVDAQRRLSYQQLSLEVRRLAAGLHQIGLRAGDRVVLQISNRVELFEALLALCWLGVAPVMALPSHRRFELSYFVERTNAVALVTARSRGGFDRVALAAEVAEQAASRPRVCVIEPPGGAREVALPWTHGGIEAVVVPRAEPRGEPAADASEVLLFQLSGGTTGTPKLIPRTHDDYLYSVRASVEVCHWSKSTCYLAVLPAQHNFPLSSPGVLGALWVGGRAVLASTAAPVEAFEWIERERVSWTSLVPSLLQAWLAAARRRNSASSSLRVIQVGGAPLPVELARRVGPELGVTLQQVFGMAEGLVCYTRLDDPLEVVVRCQGRPMSEADELRIVGEGGEPVVAGAAGELLVRGPYTIVGYYRDEAEHALRFTPDGFYRTGDRVRFTPEGNLAVVGRLKEQINRGGEKIAPAEVEAHLMAHPAVAEAAVVAVADSFLGQRSCAFVVCKGQGVSESELRAFVRERAAAHKVPDRIRFLPTLPRTLVGKIDKPRLQGASS